jgi:hypothetical protein
MNNDLMNELMREFASNYNVSWKDDQGNNWESDFLPIEEAAFLFNKLVDDPDDDNQVECCIWSCIDCKDLVRYSNIENKYYY